MDISMKLLIMLELCTILVAAGSTAMYYENRHLNEWLANADLEREHEQLQYQYDGLLALIELCNPELIEEHGLPKLSDSTADTPLFDIFGTEYDWSDELVNDELARTGVVRGEN